MNWYYVLNNEKQGPLADSEFEGLVRSGAITETTLVWREGLTNWQPYQELALLSPSLPHAKPGRIGGLCAECGGTFSLDELTRLGNSYVCAACKPVAMQKLNEGTVGNQSEQIRKAHIKHETSVRSIGLLYFLGAAILILAGPIGFLSNEGGGALVALCLLILGAAQISVGIGLRGLKPWSRVPTGILSGIGLLGFPIGTLINGYILFLVFSKKGATVFSEGYKRVIEETPHIRYRTSIVVWIFLALLLLLIGAGLLGLVIARHK